MPESLFLRISKFLMIFILPFLIFLLVANFTAFDNSFYRKEFLKYSVYKDVPQADFLHERVINFIDGKSSDLSNAFNQREKQHLLDVRSVIRCLTVSLYILFILFGSLLIASASKLKNNHIKNFLGRVLAFGGLSTIIITLVLFFLINSDFPSAFDSFHRLFFEKGTYLFDPSKDIIVKLYPEQLFMDIGIRLSKWVFALSVIFIGIGMFLIKQSKKNKNTRK